VSWDGGGSGAPGSGNASGGAGGGGGAVGGAKACEATGGGHEAGAPGCGPEGPSCAGLAACNGESCCLDLRVPGGSYVRSGSHPATVEDFCMDKYEVTVGRFSNFVAAYDAWVSAGNPAPGAGEHACGAGTGWQAAWNSSLPSSAIEGTWQKCDSAGTWGRGNDRLPINCVTWYEAFAFCIWDGGRLPTEAEWEYAAGHGDENRTYPWGNSEPTKEYAVYAAPDIAAVGSFPKGNGYWGQSDLGGNLWEWVFDYYADYPNVCDNCATASGDERIFRGGSFRDADSYLRVTARFYNLPPDGAGYQIGVRCVRTL
jgi:formylglycine-generating enzyme